MYVDSVYCHSDATPTLAFQGKICQTSGLTDPDVCMMTFLTDAMHVNAGVSSHTLQRPGAGRGCLQCIPFLEV